MSIIYGNGIGDTLGDQLATCRPLYTSGSVWYVSSAIGVDAGSPAGKNREKPLATLAQAITNAADNDIISLLSGHTETTTAGYTVNKKLTIVGSGSSGGKPTVKLNMNLVAGTLMTVSATNVELRNIWFPTSASVNSNRIVVSAALFRMKGCYVECGPNDNHGVSLAAGADSARFVNSTFISVATSITLQALGGLQLAATVNDLELDGMVFSSGTVGFSNGGVSYAFNSNGATINRLKAENVSLLLGADVNLSGVGTSGFFNSQLVTGGSRVDF